MKNVYKSARFRASSQPNRADLPIVRSTTPKTKFHSRKGSNRELYRYFEKNRRESPNVSTPTTISKIDLRNDCLDNDSPRKRKFSPESIQDKQKERRLGKQTKRV